MFNTLLNSKLKKIESPAPKTTTANITIIFNYNTSKSKIYCHIPRNKP